MFIHRLVMIYAAVKSIFSGIFAGISLIFKKPYLRVPFYIFTGILTIWFIGLLIFISNIDKNWDEIKQNNPDINTRTDAIIVLTGGSERIRTGFHLIQNDYADKLFISGVNRTVKLPELFAIHNISKENFFKLINKVEMGSDSSNTIENATEVRNWLAKNSNVKTIRLVTSNYHMKRALMELSDKIPDIEIYPHPVIPINIRLDKWWEFESSRKLLINEYNKLIAANLRIYLEKI